ncbi:hypothetical protein GYMLUDRAFT_247789, partial [Collybiopsis luxurians FD-317 M1]
VTSVAYSPDGQYVVSGSWDKTVRVWNAQTGLQAGVAPIAYSPNDQYVVPDANTANQVLQPTLHLHAASPSMHGHHPSSTSIYTPPSQKFLCPENPLQLPFGIPSGYIDDRGWLCSDNGELIIWLPPWMRHGFTDKCQVLTIPPDVFNCAVSVDWSNFAHGTQWTECWDSASTAV